MKNAKTAYILHNAEYGLFSYWRREIRMKKQNWEEAYQKMERHERYLLEKDAAHGLFFLEQTQLAELTEAEDIQNAVERNILFENLHKAIQELSEEEIYLLNYIYFKNKSILQYATKVTISYNAAWKRHEKVLKKLRTALLLCI